MSLLAHGLLSLGLFAVQEGKTDAKAPVKQETKEDNLAFAAFKLETEKRDFEAALTLWASLRSDFATAGRKDLAMKADLGRARCLIALNRKDEARMILRQSDTQNAEVRAALMNLDSAVQAGDDVKGILQGLLQLAVNHSTGAPGDPADRARDDLVRMGDVAVPQIAELLRESVAQNVDIAADLLRQIATERSIQALADALRDPHCLYPKVLTAAVATLKSSAILPFALAMVERPEVELRRAGGSLVLTYLHEMTPDAQADVVGRLLADPDVRVRRAAVEHPLGEPLVRRLVPVVEPLVSAKDAASIDLAMVFLAVNREALPAEVMTRWSEKLMQSPNAAVRRLLFDEEYNAETRSNRFIGGDHRPRSLAILRYFADFDPTVFSAGASRLEEDGPITDNEVPSGSREAMLAALVRAIELPGVSLAKRYTVLRGLSLQQVGDDELFDLFVRLGSKPTEADVEWRASARERFAKELLQGRNGEGRRDEFAAARLLQIPDSAGRMQWFELARTPQSRIPSTGIVAVGTDDVELRASGYRQLVFMRVPLESLPHLVEDLASDDPALVLAAVRTIGSGDGTKVLPSLRKLFAQSSGELHDAALFALSQVGGKDFVPEMLDAMRKTSRFGDPFPYLRELEAGLGAEKLAQELVDLARTDGSSRRVFEWIRNDRGRTDFVSSACKAAMVRTLPPALIDPSIFEWLTQQLPPDLAATVVVEVLQHGDRKGVSAAASFAGNFRIDAAWNDLVRLLDAGDGETRAAAIAALKSLREFRDLKRDVLGDDSDARREAFAKAKAMTQSKNAEQRAAAAIALAAVSDVNAIPLLLDLSGDGDATVRTAARTALEKLADRMARPSEAKGPAAASGDDAHDKTKKGN